VRKRVAVIGGGIAGLAAAVRLRDVTPADTEIIVYEQSGALGGKLRTGELAGLTVERGAESFLMTGPDGAESAAVALARRLGLGDELVHPAAIPAALSIGGRLAPVPAGTLIGVPGNSTASRGPRKVVTSTRAVRCWPTTKTWRSASWSAPATATRWWTGWSTRCSAGSTRAVPTGCRWP
jgi:protoporphyrinogen oxidase